VENDSNKRASGAIAKDATAPAFGLPNREKKALPVLILGLLYRATYALGKKIPYIYQRWQKHRARF
jgi:hypothetical protein